MLSVRGNNFDHICPTTDGKHTTDPRATLLHCVLIKAFNVFVFSFTMYGNLHAINHLKLNILHGHLICEKCRTFNLSYHFNIAQTKFKLVK